VKQLVTALLLLTACTVSRRTEGYACSTSADCENGRACESNWCVVATCPADCTTCDTTLKTCQIACASMSRCGSISCPMGWSCSITCTGNNACGNITCASGSTCAVTCSGSRSCGTLDCDAACKCDQTCSTTDACDPSQCPVAGSIQCTSDGVAGSPCVSARNAGCTKC